MRKFKLVKRYPNGPKLGTVVCYSETHCIYNSEEGDFYTELPRNQVEGLPEFWEEVDKKEFEIISFRNFESKGLTTKRCSGYWLYEGKESSDCPNGKGATTKDMMEYVTEGDYEIYQVKRLRDGEVFTIGDKVDWIGEEFTIKKFSLGDSYCYAGGINIDTLGRIKHILTTEDGVDIHEGDEFTFIWVTRPAIGQIINKPYTIKASSSLCSSWKEVTKSFSSKEKAEEFLLMGRPLLTLNDVFKVYPQFKKKELGVLTKHARDIIEIAKNKTKNNG